MEYRTLGEEKVSLLGFGCMRFPVKKGKIDEEASRKMLERALEAGVTYFDTAWPYHDGKSEAFVGSVLSGFDRSRYQLATKLPVWLVHSREDVRSFVEKQLANLRTDYRAPRKTRLVFLGALVNPYRIYTYIKVDL